jgi:3-deoxy-7-phosphoheptulonate synthase
MSFTILKKLQPVESLLQQYPLSDLSLETIQQHRREIKAILAGNDKRLLMIVGPCSAWPAPAVLEYAKRLKHLSEEIQDQIKLVMRVYVQKPRTREGWAGPLNQSDPMTEPDIELGLHYVRQMMIQIIDLGLPIAGEAVFTHNSKCFTQLLSWMAIGARSVENQEHRVYASSMDCAVGLKNPTHGSLSVAINGIIAAQHPHRAVFDGYEIQTHGNPHAHLVLRGSHDAPNHDLGSIQEAYRLMSRSVKHPALLIDASHDNSYLDGKKNPRQQPLVIFEVLEALKNTPELKSFLKGFMMESFIKTGCQEVDESKPQALDLGGLSITDPCLGWDETESFLISLAQRLKHE